MMPIPFDGGEYTLLRPHKGDAVLLIWAEDRRTDVMANRYISWRNCPLTAYATTILVWHAHQGQWVKV